MHYMALEAILKKLSREMDIPVERFRNALQVTEDINAPESGNQIDIPQCQQQQQQQQQVIIWSQQVKKIFKIDKTVLCIQQLPVLAKYCTITTICSTIFIVVWFIVAFRSLTVHNYK